MMGGSTQLGHTLRFTIDWFYSNPAQDMSKLLSAIAKKTQELGLATDLYRSAF